LGLFWRSLVAGGDHARGFAISGCTTFLRLRLRRRIRLGPWRGRHSYRQRCRPGDRSVRDGLSVDNSKKKDDGGRYRECQGNCHELSSMKVKSLEFIPLVTCHALCPVLQKDGSRFCPKRIAHIPCGAISQTKEPCGASASGSDTMKRFELVCRPALRLAE
jgi:hypothetical protein